MDEASGTVWDEEWGKVWGGLWDKEWGTVWDGGLDEELGKAWDAVWVEEWGTVSAGVLDEEWGTVWGGVLDEESGTASNDDVELGERWVEGKGDKLALADAWDGNGCKHSSRFCSHRRHRLGNRELRRRHGLFGNRPDRLRTTVHITMRQNIEVQRTSKSRDIACKLTSVELSQSPWQSCSGKAE